MNYMAEPTRQPANRQVVGWVLEVVLAATLFAAVQMVVVPFLRGGIGAVMSAQHEADFGPGIRADRELSASVEAYRRQRSEEAARQVRLHGEQPVVPDRLVPAPHPSPPAPTASRLSAPR